MGFYYERCLVPDSGTTGCPIYFHVVDWAVKAVEDKELCYGSLNNTIPGRYNEFDASLGSLRDPLDAYLKFNLVDWGLSDASMYLNNDGDYFRWCIALGARKMLKDSGPDDRYMIVSHSLGSTIVLDTIRMLWHDTYSPDETAQLQLGWKSWRKQYADDKNPFATLFAPIDNTGVAHLAIYTCANQYALLSLSRPEESLEHAADEIRNSQSRPHGQVQIVAFTDPDDLLSFPIARQDDPFKVSNVYLSNNTWKVPYLGVNPIRLTSTTSSTTMLSKLFARVSAPTSIPACHNLK